MKVQRDPIPTIPLSEENDDGYVPDKPGEGFEMIWEITCDAWAFGGGESTDGSNRHLPMQKISSGH